MEPIVKSKKIGQDIAKKFVEDLEKCVKDICDKYYKNPKKMIMTMEDDLNYKNAKVCHICEEEFSDKDKTAEAKVRDHCHVSGKFGVAAHNSCNLKFKKPKMIPVTFHNLSNMMLTCLLKSWQLRNLIRTSFALQTPKKNTYYSQRRFVLISSLK